MAGQRSWTRTEFTQTGSGTQNVNLGGTQFNERVETVHIHESERRPQPRNAISVNRDLLFVERKSILTELEVALQSSEKHSRVALIGSSGVGKSQIAAEYAYRFAASASNTWIFWVNAASAKAFKRSYVLIANDAKIPGRNDSEADHLHLVHQWFQHTEERWLLIVDGYDDASVLSQSWPDVQQDGDDRSLGSYLPSAATGSIIMTTRNEDAVFGMSETSIYVDKMNKSDARSLFKNTLALKDRTVTNESIDPILKALEYIPLGITQAATYISMDKKCTPEMYLGLLKRNPLKYLKEKNHTGKGYRVSETVLGSIQLSFESLGDGAKELLYMISFLSLERIPKEIIHASPQKWDQEHWDILCTHRLVEEERSGDYYRIRHRLVQWSVRDWLQEKQLVDRYASLALRAIDTLFPDVGGDDYALFGALILHVTQLVEPSDVQGLSVEFKTEEESKINADLLYRAAWYRMETAEYQGAADWTRRADEIHERLFGPSDLATLRTQYQLSSIHNCLGQRKKAIELGKKVIEELEESPAHRRQSETSLNGEVPPNGLQTEKVLLLLRVKVAIANVYYDEGDLAEAEKVTEEALNASKNIPRSPESVRRMLAVKLLLIGIYMDRSKSDLVGPLLEMDDEEKRLLEENHDIETARLVKEFALNCWSRGDYEKAEIYMDRAIKAHTSKYDAENPFCLNLRSAMALIYIGLGKLEQAEDLLREILPELRKTCGEDHLDTLSSENSLAWTLQLRGRYAESIQLSLAMIKKIEELFPDDTLAVLLCKSTLGTTYRLKGDLKAALEVGEDVLAKRESILGRAHHHSLISRINLALVYNLRGQHSEMQRLIPVKEVDSLQEQLAMQEQKVQRLKQNSYIQLGICAAVCAVAFIAGRVSRSK